ncbi:MAG: hypothetical protein F7B17_05815 [Desulfurococcales archaeon]|nr:hypothetical protein [Desulfurococcales archaeon]
MELPRRVMGVCAFLAGFYILLAVSALALAGSLEAAALIPLFAALLLGLPVLAATGSLPAGLGAALLELLVLALWVSGAKGFTSFVLRVLAALSVLVIQLVVALVYLVMDAVAAGL